MKTSKDEAALFRSEFIRWQSLFGLTDWTVQFKVEEATQGTSHEADIDYDCETRHAVSTYFTGVEDSLHPSDVACHEVQHLLFADMLLAAIQSGPRRGESDPVVAREEHRVIERQLKVFGQIKTPPK